ncbi:MAG: hypothetical protein JW990_07835 [Thermoleophilia bacterium]|nr:hypothetical protein [Thermoleophilia bacterium]
MKKMTVPSNKVERNICTYCGLDFVSSPWKPVEGCMDDEGEAADTGAGS